MKTNKFLLLIALIAILSFSNSCSKKEEAKEKPKTDSTATESHEGHNHSAELIKLSAEAVKDIHLTTMQVVESDVIGEIIAPARLAPNQDLEAYVGSMVAGRVGKVFVNLGSNVKKGQILMQIEGLEIGTIKSQFLKAKAAFEYAKANYNRSKTLNEQMLARKNNCLSPKPNMKKH